MTERNVALAFVAGAATLAVGVLLAIAFFGSPVHMVYCDGSFPRWMLEAQGYQGGGCAEVLPTSEAPANADWSLYCIGTCDAAGQESLNLGPR